MNEADRVAQMLSGCVPVKYGRDHYYWTCPCTLAKFNQGGFVRPAPETSRCSQCGREFRLVPEKNNGWSRSGGTNTVRTHFLYNDCKETERRSLNLMGMPKVCSSPSRWRRITERFRL